MSFRTYAYRSLPCVFLGKDLTWCVSGRDTITGDAGILEWCHDERDAREVLRQMSQSGEFADLRAYDYQR